MTAAPSRAPRLRVSPMTDGFGAYVSGPALAQLLADPEDAAQVRALIQRHRALILTGLSLDANALLALAGTLGTVRPARVRHASLPVPAADHLFVSMRTPSAVPPPPSAEDDAHVWHVDYTFVDPPPHLSMLYAVTAPASGSRTWFADMAAVHAALPEALQAEIADLKACHYAHPRGAGEVPDDAPPVPWADRQRGVHHPLVQVNDTGQPCLILPARLDTPIVGWDEARSRALLERLWPYVESHGRVWDVALGAGELQIWDNRTLLHKRSAWPLNEERLLWFLTTQ